MLQLSLLREQKADVVARLAVKNMDAQEAVDQILALDSEKRKTQLET